MNNCDVLARVTEGEKVLRKTKRHISMLENFSLEQISRDFNPYDLQKYSVRITVDIPVC
jgi:hypothetical protein